MKCLGDIALMHSIRNGHSSCSLTLLDSDDQRLMSNFTSRKTGETLLEALGRHLINAKSKIDTVRGRRSIKIADITKASEMSARKVKAEAEIEINWLWEPALRGLWVEQASPRINEATKAIPIPPLASVSAMQIHIEHEEKIIQNIFEFLPVLFQRSLYIPNAAAL